MIRTLIICDIDGVLADCSHRLHYLKEKRYDAFYGAEMLDDDPKNVKAVCEAFPDITGITFGVKRME